jgi:hypothetical protein
MAAGNAGSESRPRPREDTVAGVSARTKTGLGAVSGQTVGGSGMAGEEVGPSTAGGKPSATSVPAAGAAGRGKVLATDAGAEEGASTGATTAVAGAAGSGLLRDGGRPDARGGVGASTGLRMEAVGRAAAGLGAEGQSIGGPATGAATTGAGLFSAGASPWAKGGMGLAFKGVGAVGGEGSGTEGETDALTRGTATVEGGLFTAGGIAAGRLGARGTAGAEKTGLTTPMAGVGVDEGRSGG